MSKLSVAHRANQLREWDKKIGGWYGRAKGIAAMVGVLIAVSLAWGLSAMLTGSALWIAMLPVGGFVAFCLYHLLDNVVNTRSASELIMDEVQKNIAPLNTSLKVMRWFAGRSWTSVNNATDKN